MAGYEAEVKGESNSEGESTFVNKKSSGISGKVVDNKQAINNYTNEALKQLDESEIPYGMKDLVEKYFSTLEE